MEQINQPFHLTKQRALSFEKHHKSYDRATVAKNGGKTNRKFSIVNRSRRRIIANSFQERFVFHAIL